MKLPSKPQPTRWWIYTRRFLLVLLVLGATTVNALGIILLGELFVQDVTRSVREQSKPCSAGQQFSHATGAACKGPSTP